MDGGTLLQLRNLLNRSSVPSDSKRGVNAADDFLQVVLIGHVMSAAMEVLGMNSLDDQPSSVDYSSLGWPRLTREHKCQLLNGISHSVVSKFVNLATLKDNDVKKKKEAKKESESEVDGILEYAKECLTLCLLKAEFDDAVHEGDGQRLLTCWKFLLLIFKATQHKNYSIEALNLLAQYNFLLPPRLANQLLYSRFVNVEGKLGRNISCDLHMEHLNAACKFAIAGLGSNVTPQAITRIGRCIGPLMKACEQFDSILSLRNRSGLHNMPDTSKDITSVVKQLQKSSVFCYKKGRFHTSFKSITCSLLSNLDKKELLKWMNAKIKNTLI